MKARLLVASMVALLGGAGVMHFVAAEKFATVVPPALGNPKGWVWGSGVAELGTAACIAVPRTRRFGGLAAALLFVVVFPANVYAALKGGYKALQPPLDSATAAWVRLPMQAVLIWWALLIRKGAIRA